MNLTIGVATATSVLTSTPSGTPTRANETPIPPAPSGLATLDLEPNRRSRLYYDSRVSCFPLARTGSKSTWH